MEATLSEYIATQDDLVREAALALPHQFSQCTYVHGPLRQAVYLCLTCPEARGLCSACSIACHTDHNQIELFPKRNFRCDCPTTAIAHPCSLHKIAENENASNVYGQNFRALFCRCGRTYDAKTEQETMIQCLACEDWFHESCCNLRERPPPDSGTDVPPAINGGEEVDDDAASEASSSGLPRPLISGEEYESFVCASCVNKIPTLKRWAGTPGIIMVVRRSSADAWTLLDGDEQRVDSVIEIVDSSGPSNAGSKRSRSPSLMAALHPDAKRPRASSPSHATPTQCLAPAPNPFAATIYAAASSAGDTSSSLGVGDLFLTEGFRERWCRCPSCLPSLEANRFLLEEEDTYEPPDDPDSGLSLEELGMRALERLPRERAIDGIHAFNEMRDKLVKHLRPFAQEGKVVNEADVKEFFATLKEEAAGRKRS